MTTSRIEEMEKTLENLSFWNALDMDEQWELRTALNGTRQAGKDEEKFRIADILMAIPKEFIVRDLGGDVRLPKPKCILSALQDNK